MSAEEKEASFLVFSDDWGGHPSSCQHLFRHISLKHEVLWVNTIGMRNPKLSIQDLNKLLLKVGRIFKNEGGRHGNERGKSGSVQVCIPPMLPFSNLQGVRHANQVSVTRLVRKRLSELGMEKPILVTTVPNACDYIGKCNESKVVYYCVDDFTEWPGLEKSLVRGMEQDLVSKTDLYVATSHKLFQRLSRNGRPTHLLTHGVDLDMFRQGASREHKALQRAPKPRVGYFGLFDERSDQELLSQLAMRMPDISFVITGSVEVDISRLSNISNIFFTGKVPYHELPFILEGLDVMVLPYVVNELTDAISPLKLKEYLAAGKPVVSTPIAEVVRLKEYIEIAEDFEKWEQILRICIGGISKKTKNADSFIEDESWEKKAGKFLDICLKGPAKTFI